MKLLLLIPFLVSSAFSASGNEKNIPPWPERWQLQHAAMTLIKDVVPHAPVSNAIAKLFDDRDCAIWGKFFRDAQIGALVAVKSDKAKANDDAYLCLLLWKGGWKFAQWVGKVQWKSGMTDWPPSETEHWNWGIKRRISDSPNYVISSLDLNAISYREHFSWLCDPKTHSLLSTGWPKNAMPSLSGGTITFQRCEKSGYAPTVFEIDQFDGKPGKNLASYTDKFEGEDNRLLPSACQTQRRESVSLGGLRPRLLPNLKLVTTGARSATARSMEIWNLSTKTPLWTSNGGRDLSGTAPRSFSSGV